MSEAVAPPKELPFGSLDRKGVGWWGILCLVATEAALFGYLIFGYAFTAVQEGAGWMPAHPPHLRLAGPNTLLLLLSSVAVWWGEQGVRRGRRGQLLLGLALGLMLGVVFVGIQLEEWRDKTFTLSSSGYASHYFTITGFHMAHVIAGLFGLALMLIWAIAGYLGRERHAALTYAGVYWHFVDAVWLVVFTTFYLAPRIV